MMFAVVCQTKNCKWKINHKIKTNIQSIKYAEHKKRHGLPTVAYLNKDAITQIKEIETCFESATSCEIYWDKTKTTNIRINYS